jgi:hypothetical protein
MLEVADLHGLWHRSLLVRADATRDTTTWVAWLQGLTLYADLRVPAGRPSFRGARGRRDLTQVQAAWLASQQGFAGRLDREGEFFVWRRWLDFQPVSDVADAGRLREERGVVVEEGRDDPYIEHWHRQPVAGAPIVGARLRDQHSGGEGVIVRVGPSFMYARAGYSALLPTGTLLADHVAAATSLRDAQELVDCEISFGSIAAGGAWKIERSSLPYREGACLAPALGSAFGSIQTDDVTEEGHAMRRSWDVIEFEGDATALQNSGAVVQPQWSDA